LIEENQKMLQKFSTVVQLVEEQEVIYEVSIFVEYVLKANA